MSVPDCINMISARFWGKVRKTKDACWIWAASKRSKGYGAFVWTDPGGRIVQGRAHRFAWQLARGPIPEDMCVLHHCDVPACVRVDHLYLGTRADNNADMIAKGRKRNGGTRTPSEQCHYERGEQHHAAKLRSSTVQSLRADRVRGLSYSALGRKYGIVASSAYKIATRKQWTHVS